MLQLKSPPGVTARQDLAAQRYGIATHQAMAMAANYQAIEDL
jgi:hypothetical protein